MEAVFTLALSEAELAELHQRADAAGFRSTAEWARRILLAVPPPTVPPPLGGASGSAPDPEVLERVQARAAELGVPVSDLVRTLLADAAPKPAPHARDDDSVAEDLELATTVRMERVEPAPDPALKKRPRKSE